MPWVIPNPQLRTANEIKRFYTYVRWWGVGSSAGSRSAAARRRSGGANERGAKRLPGAERFGFLLEAVPKAQAEKCRPLISNLPLRTANGIKTIYTMVGVGSSAGRANAS